VSVVVLDDVSTGFAWAVAEPASLVVGDEALVQRIIEDHFVQVIIHFAGSVVVPDSVADPLGYYHNNTVKSHTLIAAAVAKGVTHFIFCRPQRSTATPSPTPVYEDAVLKLMTPYGTSKLMTEFMLADTARAHDLRYVALRFSTSQALIRTAAPVSQRRAPHT